MSIGSSYPEGLSHVPKLQVSTETKLSTQCSGYFSNSCSCIFLMFLLSWLNYWSYWYDLLLGGKIRVVKCFASALFYLMLFEGLCACVSETCTAFLVVVIYSVHRCGFVRNRILSTDPSRRPWHKRKHLKIMMVVGDIEVHHIDAVSVQKVVLR